ncbi:MAG TPA: hypothetical protein VJP88_09805, partial [Caulobacteraceae bacterium]|nr:hypothetical protein [Caulobacteraceae bacterium]
MSKLHVITTYWNPIGYRSRRALYEQFRKRMADDRVELHTIELSTDERGFEVTHNDDPRHIQVRSADQLWYKENLINIAVRALPADWEFAAWVDADVAFVRPDWADQAMEELRHHAFVQLFTHVVDLGPQYEPLETQDGFAYGWVKSGRQSSGWFGQPGGAWAVTRDAFEQVGGLIDWSIMGSNDYFAALGLTGGIEPEKTRMPGSTYATMLLDWQNRCEQS